MLAVLLDAHAHATPAAPWLFAPEGHDWRWFSYACGRLWLEAGCAALGAAGPLAGRRIGCLDRLTPRTVLAQLALERVGATPVAVAPEASAGGLDGWFLTLDGEQPPAGLAVVGTLPGRPSYQLDRLPATVPRLEGALTAPAAALAARLPAAAERDIVVLAGSLADAQLGALLGWSLAIGAATLLEPDSRAALASAVWARSTVVVVSGEELATLRGLPGVDSLKPLSPMGRLRAVWTTSEPDAATRRYWQGRGVSLLAL
jgi:hypothetical protein